MKFKAKIEKGKIVFPDTAACREQLQKLEGKEVSIVLKRWASPRSNAANNYYWGVIIEGAVAAFAFLYGEEMTPEIAHLNLKLNFNPIRVRNRQTGKDVILPGSTAELSRREFYKYCESIRSWAYHFAQISISTPEDFDWQKWIEQEESKEKAQKNA